MFSSIYFKNMYSFIRHAGNYSFSQMGETMSQLTGRIILVTVEGRQGDLYSINLDCYPSFEGSLERFKRVALKASIHFPPIIGYDEESLTDRMGHEFVFLDGIFKITHIFYGTPDDTFLKDLVHSKKVPIEFVRKSRARIHLEPECDDNPGYGEVVKADHTQYMVLSIELCHSE